MSKIAKLAIVVILVSATVAIAVTVVGARPTLEPSDVASTSATTSVLPPADEATARITVPPGFAIRVFAAVVPGTPRFMAFGPDGHLYVSLMNAGQIARLPDRNGDGLSDGVEIVASFLSSPHGIEWRDGWLYVATTAGVRRFHDSNGDGSLDVNELVTANIPGTGGHSTRTIHFGPDGKLYVAAGSSCNLCVETDPRRAAVLRFNADGSIPADNPYAADPDPQKQPVWASGLRNSVDFLFTPDGQLWADHNGSDALGDGLPPEEIVIPVSRGKHYGWPYCYTPVIGANLPPNQQGEVPDPRLTGFDCATAVPALFTDLAHSAPLGMTLGTQAAFPANMRADLYVAYHGSWNTAAPASFRDCKVERIVVQGGLPIRSEDFATGWRAPGGLCGDAATWGRPADVIIGPDGAMYISDDKAGRAYRVVYTGNLPSWYLPEAKRD
jgi:glucose/arabinose dehydrogenase